jgi:hypothetical protein
MEMFEQEVKNYTKKAEKIMTVKSTPKEVGTLKALLNANVELKEANMTIGYSLMEAETYQNVYFIMMRCENDSATVFAGNDEKTAKCLIILLFWIN